MKGLRVRPALCSSPFDYSGSARIQEKLTASLTYSFSMPAKAAVTVAGPPAFVLEIKNIKFSANSEDGIQRGPWRSHKIYVSISIGGIKDKTKLITAKGRMVQWDDMLSFYNARITSDADSTQIAADTILELSLKVKHCIRTRLIFTIRENVATLLHSSSEQHFVQDITLQGLSYQIQFDIIKCTPSEHAANIAAEASAAMGKMNISQNLPSPPDSAAGSTVTDTVSALAPLLTTADVVDKVASVISQIHPWAKMAHDILFMGYQVIRDGVDRDSRMQELMATVKVTCDFAKDAVARQDLADGQKNIIIKMLQQVVECCLFIRDYAKDESFVARACKQAFKDTDELIDKYKAKFEEYRRAFDSNNIHQIQIECIQIMDKLTSS